MVTADDVGTGGRQTAGVTTVAIALPALDSGLAALAQAPSARSGRATASRAGRGIRTSSALIVIIVP